MPKYFNCPDHPTVNVVIHDLLMSPPWYAVSCAWTAGRPGSKEFVYCAKTLGNVYYKRDGTYTAEPKYGEVAT